MVKIDIAICWKPRKSEMQCSRCSFPTQPHERLSNDFVDELCRRNSKVKVVKDEGAAAPVRSRLFTFRVPANPIRFDFISTRDFDGLYSIIFLSRYSLHV